MSFQSLLQAALNEDDLLESVQDQQFHSENGDAGSNSQIRAARKQTIANSDRHSDIEMETASESAHDSDEESSYEEEEEADSDVERQLWGNSRGKRKYLRRKRVSHRRSSVVPSKLSPELSAMLGEANMMYASHQYDQAIVLLKDFIKKAPTIPDPYHTLGMIYEDRKNKSKALQFFLIACTLTPGDAELWKHVGRIAKEENNMQQAIFCFRSACKADPKDKDAVYSYIEICQEQGDERSLAPAYKKLALLYPNDLSMWMQVAEAYHAAGKNDEAIEALQTCITKACADSAIADAQQVESNAVNMLADLYITLKKYQDAIHLIKDFHARNSAKSSQTDQDFLQSLDLPLDIVIKYGICHLFINEIETAESVITRLYSQDVETYMDLFVDVADAYIAISAHDVEAIQTLKLLLPHEKLLKDDIFVRYAECHARLGMTNIALEYFEKAIAYQHEKEDLLVSPAIVLQGVVIARQLKEEKRGLHMIQHWLPEVLKPAVRPYWKDKYRDERDQKASSDPEDEDEITRDDDEEFDSNEEEDENIDGRQTASMQDDPYLSVDAMDNRIRLKLLIEWGRLKSALGDVDALCNVGVPIIMGSLNQTPLILHPRRLQNSIAPQLSLTQSDFLKSKYKIDVTDEKQRNSVEGISLRVSQQVVVSRVLGEESFYALVIEVAKALTECEKHTAAIELLTDVNASDKVYQSNRRFELRFLALVIALEFGENRMAYECARLNILEDFKNPAYWNLFARVITITGAYSFHQKFLAKVLKHDPTNYPCIVLAGHQSSYWDISLMAGEFTLAYQQDKEDPLVLFCLGMAFLTASMQRTINDRQHAVAKAFAFLQQYQTIRTAESDKDGNIPSAIDTIYRRLECWYNFGRAHQQLGLYHLAIAMYERVLRACEEAKEIPAEYDLARETAHNLSLIYKQSGANDLARYLMRKYLTF
uniref:Transcription factor putative n=1 Tax=Albugo laibachii Nc14 TaxID=890382 RepID=F0VZ03_9STRA|nr:transcription factor putative [Albugo laibachii Nc14]|eukprot:CCA14018.1 transcription factor putative [Albugo laibachii Nc14]